MPAPHPLLSDPDWLRSRYIDDELSIAEIAAEAGADLSTVHLWLGRHGFPARRYQIDRAVVEGMLDQRKSIRDIAEHYDVDPAVIRDRLHRWGLATPSTAVEYDLDQLREWYEVRDWPIHRIADKLEVSRRTATRLLLAAGATLRGPGRRTHG